MNSLKHASLLIVSTYPPRECGIATYTRDLVQSINSQFGNGNVVEICALENDTEQFKYGAEVRFRLNTSNKASYGVNVQAINRVRAIDTVIIQHEFGLFNHFESSLLYFMSTIRANVIIAFHTVLPNASLQTIHHVQQLAGVCVKVIVMTESAARILNEEYNIPFSKITIIAHGTHLIKHQNKQELKAKYGYENRSILSTFGLMSSGKNIETTLRALPQIVTKNPSVLFLIIGKTHPSVVKNDGEVYREKLIEMISFLSLQKHVQFINQYVILSDLLEYLQLTDVYVFSSNDPKQAVSGTFSYALSSGCPIVSTPIPHALEVMKSDVGILFDFEDDKQLSHSVDLLLNDNNRAAQINSNALHTMAPTAWQNSAISHMKLINQYTTNVEPLVYAYPQVNIDHVKAMTTNIGIIQFSKIAIPDIESGYTIDDNARALVAIIMHFEATLDEGDLKLISIYLNFIALCVQPNGSFLNYVDQHESFTHQNSTVNLDDSNGRTFWALGFLISKKEILPSSFIIKAELLFTNAIPHITQIHSTRAIAFVLKGLYHYNLIYPSIVIYHLAMLLGNRLEKMYLHECDIGWNWYEGYLTYANSILPEGLLCAYMITFKTKFKVIARESFDFLLANMFFDNSIKPISNNGWLQKGIKAESFGEQPIDVAYTILCLKRFYDVFGDESYRHKMEISFSWFLGNNHLHKIIYNPITGGCYDGLEETHVNLNQGAESTISYLLARLTMNALQLYEKGNDFVKPHQKGILQTAD